MKTMTTSIIRMNRHATVLAAGLLITAMPAYAELPFATATVERRDAPLERLLDGTVEAVNQATMSAQTSGRVAEVFYDVDDFVEPGQPVVRFSDVEQQAALRQANAALAEANALSSEASDHFERVAGLFESGSASQGELDRARAARDSAAARVASAQSAVAAAKQQVEYTLVRAPYAGIVTERHVEPGEAVGVGQPLMSGLSLEALRVVVDLPQQAATGVREHRQAYIITSEGRIEATDVTIFPYAHSASNTFRVRLELPDGQYGLYPGMFVKVAFIVGESQRLLVPTAALVRRSEVTGVYVVDDQDRVRMRQVRVGGRFGELTEILSGLREGERVAGDPVRAGIYVKTMSVQADER
jgi:RND family efflux transporter MFP subunit